MKACRIGISCRYCAGSPPGTVCILRIIQHKPYIVYFVATPITRCLVLNGALVSYRVLVV